MAGLKPGLEQSSGAAAPGIAGLRPNRQGPFGQERWFSHSPMAGVTSFCALPLT